MKTQFYFKSIIPRLFIILLVGGIAFSTGGCKSKKKLAQEAAAKEYADRVAKAIAELEAILNDDGTMPVVEMERRLNDIKSQNLNDTRVNELIKQVEAKIAAQKEALRQKQLDDQKKQETAEEQTYHYIDEYFKQVANSKTVPEANAKIAEAMKMFSSPDVPVLIIISKSGTDVDYDKPTTIEKYLNYLKDTKNYNNSVYSVKMDGYGQIVSLELIKN
ncbi:MAG TPA: hypothetical protein P5514_14405 [Bacteroidales bacterium]|nr:hypothetical protein [Bacteroidales bacterium]HRX98137.1 hypothetical protein [Bacteroidales bacterium]